MTTAHTTRQMMASPDWNWRHAEYHNDVERRAAQILRGEYRRAATWLARVSELAGMPLASGNGMNGPWHRLACVTPNGFLGIVDITRGRAIEYDAVCPSYVRRFASTIGGRGTSVNPAGGGGGVPADWRQVAVVLGGHDASVRVPHEVSPLNIIWGLRTCYGTIGDEPTANEYWEEWRQYFGRCEISETTEPQRQQVPLSRGVDPKVWEDFSRGWDYRKSYRGLVTTTGSNWSGFVYVHVTARRAERERAIADLLHDWRAHVVRHSQKLVAELWERCGLDLPDTEGGRRYRTWDHHGSPDAYQLNTVAAALRTDPMASLNEAEREEVRITAEQMLASDIATVAAKVREHAASYRGSPHTAAQNLSVCGYAAGIKEYLYLRVRGDWTHVMEYPGIRAWHQEVIRAVS